MFEISEFETTDTATFVVKNPKTGAPTPAVITLAGRDSELYRKISRDLANKRAEAVRAGGREAAAISDDEMEAEALDLLTALTVDFSGIESGGAPYAFSKENARALYERLPWLREDVDRFIGNRANFMKA